MRNFSTLKPSVHFISKFQEMELRLQDEYKLILEEKNDFKKLDSEIYSFESIEKLYHNRLKEIESGINISLQ